MKKELLHSFLWCLFVLCFFSYANLKAQTVDSTGLFTAIKAGATDTVVHASLMYYDVDADGNYDAAFSLSAGPITAWGDYSAAVGFYTDGIKGRNQATNNLIADTVINVVPGTVTDLWIVVDINNLDANYWVKSADMTYAALILSDGGFRRTDIDSIVRWSAFHNPSGEPDSLGAITVELTSTENIPGINVASLSALNVDVGTLDPVFEPVTTTYSLLVPYGTTTVNVSAASSVFGAPVTGTGPVDVSSGSGTASVTVTSYDGSASETYTVNIAVDDPTDDAILVDISSNIGTVDPIFHSDTLEYDLIVPQGTASIDLSATANYAGATVSGDGTITLTDGSATASIVVTSADASTSETYTVNIMEADGRNYGMYFPGVDGNSSNIDISGLGVDTLPYTIEMWIKPEGTQINNSGLIYHRSTGNAGIQYSSGWQGAGKLRIMTNIGGDYGTLTDAVTTDVWHHIAAVVTDTTRTIYLDGKKYKQTIANADYDFSDGKLYIGWDMGANDRAFKGVIDEVRVWNVYKDSTTLADDKFNTLNGDETGLAGYWNFNLKNSVQAVDLSGNGLHGPITGVTYVASFEPTDATLSGLSVDAGWMSPAFNPDSTTYTVVFPADTNSIEVTAAPSNPLAVVAGTGAVDVSSGSATASIEVTAFDGTTKKTYIINFVEYDGNLSLTHSYTFEEGTAADVVGGADGTVVGGTINDGAYTASADGEYIDLPAGDITIDRYPSITLELCITAGNGVNGTNVMTSYFGNTTGSYGTDYYFTSHKSRAAISCNNTSSPWSAESGVTGTTLDDGKKHHLVSTLTNDSISWYVDGQLVGKAEVSADNKIKNLGTDYAYLCKSGYTGDKTWMGTVHEYNIFVGEMTDSAIVARALAFLPDTIATLSSLSVDAGSLVPEFNADSTEYTLTVPYGMNLVTVTAVPDDENSTVTGDGAIDVSSGSATATIVVTAEDGTTTLTYTIEITVEQPSDDATLSALSLSVGALVPDFDPSVTSYTAAVPTGTTSVTVTATPNNENATVTGDGAIDVSSGSATVSIEVTAQDGSTKLGYTVAISVSPGSGINEANNSLARVYPTITNGNFNVEFNGSHGTISVYDITGQLVLVKNAASAKESISIPKAGIYFIHINTENAATTMKVVKLK